MKPRPNRKMKFFKHLKEMLEARHMPLEQFFKKYVRVRARAPIERGTEVPDIQGEVAGRLGNKTIIAPGIRLGDKTYMK